jgi:myosin heavy subunit
MQATEFDKTLSMDEKMQMPDLRFVWLPHEQHQFICGAVVLPPLSKGAILGIEPMPEVDFQNLPESTVLRIYDPPPFSTFTTDTKQWVNVDMKNYKETKIGLLSPAERKFFHGAHPSGVLSLEDDLVRLEQLEEAAVMHLMRARFVREHIYTYVGDIVLAYNPFKRIPALYGRDALMTYKPVHKNPSLKASLPPHVYATAAVAYWNLVNEHIDQALIISGESGSGKTENTKFALQLFSEISSSGGAAATVGVEEAVMLSNPVLEGFGNAKTVRNDNSSRFGKWMDIVFDKKTGSIIGAEITPYLLEKSRVVGGAGALERSFHVFYQLCTGGSPELKKRLGINNVGDFEYFAKSVKTVDNVDDKKNFDEMMDSFTKLQYTAEEIDAIFRITAAIMHMGNLAIVEKNGGEASDFADNAKATFVAELLGLTVDNYKKANLERQIKTRNEVNTVFYKPSQAVECRDNIAKSMYEALFEWIVVRMNQFLSVSTPPETRLNMGCLDIFGFECFQRNSVEQFLINLTNERLQNHFINHILKTEQEEYKIEGVPCEEIVYKDNSETINFLNVLIENYDEEVMLPKGSDQNLITRLNQKFGGKEKHPFYSAHKLKQTEFIMQHYAGVVSYDVIGFTDKNRDALNDYVFECFDTGNFEVLKSFFKPKVFNDPPAPAAGASSKNLTEQKSSGQSSKKKTNTLCGKFQGQLANLIGNIQKRTPHFIRCLKANEVKKPGIHDSGFVLNQIRYSGLLEIIKIRTAGFAYRRPFANFCERFDMLLRPFERKTLPVNERVMRIKAKAIPPELEQHFLVGKSKIFYREQALKAMQEALINKRSEMSTMLQSLARRVVMRRKFLRVQATLRAALDLMETSNLPALKDLIKQSANLESIELVMPKLNSLADYLSQEIPLCEEIRLAMNETGPEKLLAAMKKSDKLEMGVKTMNDKVIELLKKAEEQRKIYVKQAEAREKLLASMKVVDVATVVEALKEARDIKIPEKNILDDAEKYIAELKKEDDIFAKMIATIDTKKIDAIEKAYLECTAIQRTNQPRQEALEKVRGVMVQFYEHILNVIFFLFLENLMF